MTAPGTQVLRWRGPLFAIALAIAIAALLQAVLPTLRTEGRLRRAATQLIVDPVACLKGVYKSGDPGQISARQRRLGADLAARAFIQACAGKRILDQVGTQAFDPDATQPYVTTSGVMMLLFALPEPLRCLKPGIRVFGGDRDLCEVRVSEDGVAARGEVPIPQGGAVVADVDIVCPVGAYGVVTAPIARGLRFVQKSTGPMLKLVAGGRPYPLADGANVRVQVRQGERIRVEARDDLGVSGIQWSVDEIACDPFAWPADPAGNLRIVELPADLTTRAANARLVDLRASNAFITTHAVVTLLVRDPEAAPVARVQVAGADVGDGAFLHVSEKRIPVAVTLATGESADDVAILLDEEAGDVEAAGQEALAHLASRREGAHSLVVRFKDRPIVRATLRVDWTAPAIAAVLDPGRFARDLEVRKALHHVPIGSIVCVTVSDAVALDRSLVKWDVDPGMEEILEPDIAPAAPPSDTEWVRRFRCVTSGERHLRVSGADKAGNRTTIHEYWIRAADPMEGRVITINGARFPAEGTVYASRTRLDVRTDGGIEVDGLAFVLLDADRPGGGIVARTMLDAVDRPGVRAGALDAGAVSDSPRRLTGMLVRNEQELARGTVVIDVKAPVIEVRGLVPAGDAGPPGSYFADPEQEVIVAVSDDVAIDVRTISVLSGASIAKIDPGDRRMDVSLRLPPVIDEPVVMRAADEAGNVAEVRLVLVPREK